MFGGETQKVTLLFEPCILSDMFDRFGDDIRIKKADDNTFSVDVTVQISKTFFAWIVGTQGKVKIKSPRKVVDEFKMPLTIDLCDKQGMLLLLKEILSEYNNHKHPNYFISSITKLLDDTVYNENSNAICYYKISRRMVSLLDKELRNSDEKYYEHYFLDKNSALNGTYSHKRDYDQEFILSLSFTCVRKD